MTDQAANTRRIAKNTLMLYIRMGFSMLVSLYTSRVVLNTLGVEDYGIYNVVGGVIAMFGFLNGAMTTTTTRYITFELGRGNLECQQKVFSATIQIHFLIALCVLLMGETIGLWFMYEKMIIPSNRMDAAMWVFQCSTFATIVGIVSVPYNASIVAHEKMSVFAYISIIEVVLKLLIVYILLLWDVDKLVLYSILVLSVQLLIRLIYGRYCGKHFAECEYVWVWDRPLFKEMLSFTSWNLWGNCASMLSTTGVNMLLNMFFGPVVNAARGIATQVLGVVTAFSGNFQMALNPQIIKSYAQKDLPAMHDLIIKSSRFSFFLIFIVSLPIFFSTDYLLRLWLKTVPQYTAIFVQLYLIIAIIDGMANSLMIAAVSTGQIRKYQSVVGGVILFIIPISYIALLAGLSPVSVFVVHLIISISAFIVRVFFISNMVHLSQVYFYKVLLRSVLPVFISSFLIASATQTLCPPSNIINVLLLSLLCVIYASFFTYLLGLERKERKLVNEKIRVAYAKLLRA